MTNTFAIDVIQALQVEEVEEFKIFLESPYCTKGYNAESVRLFFEVIYGTIQKGEIEKIEKEDVHQVIFPGKPFIESKIDKLMSDLKRLLERFLLSQRYFSDQNESRNLLDLITEMRLRGLETRYQQALEKTKRFTDASGQESLNSLFFRYLLAREEREWNSTYNRAKGDLNIPETISHLDTFYFTERTAVLNQLMLQKKAATLSDSLKEINENYWDVPQRNLEKSALLNISWDIHLLLKKDPCQVEDFHQLLNKIRSAEKKLDPGSLAEFYTYLRNFCVILIDAGFTQFNWALHEINKDNLERGYFYLDGKLLPNACLNITQAALNVGAVSWAMVFVDQHKNIIHGENETQDFYRMNKALCLFGEKRYEEALAMIPFGSTYSAYHLMARRLELKIYYELHSELLDHKIDAFKMFISRAGRKVFSATLHELYTNFVNFVRQLHQSGPQTKQRSETLVKRISEKKMVAERLWLLEKAKELGEKR